MYTKLFFNFSVATEICWLQNMSIIRLSNKISITNFLNDVIINLHCLQTKTKSKTVHNI